MLWGRSGNKCAFPDCRIVLIEDETETDDESIIGDEAHIVARELNGPRGQSSLTSEQIDKYDNLILLCKNHHKLIDDQPNEYTIATLQQMKRQHIDWVNNTQSPNAEKQKDDEIYAMYIDKWIELSNINNWQAWTSWIFGGGQPGMAVSQYDNLEQLNEYILSRVWTNRYPDVEFAFNNFRLILNDFLRVFSEYKEKIGTDEQPWYNTEKFYRRLEKWDQKENYRLTQKFDYHVDLVSDLMCELTRAGNYLCDQIRKFISSSFRIKEGLLLVTSGPNIDMGYETYRLEYKSKDECKYPGLKKFMEIREQRSLYFGKGISNEYFPPSL